jgi:hypothetical protein
MSNTLGIDMGLDAQEMETDWGQTCTIGSTSVNCVASTERRAIEITPEEDIVIYDRDLQVREAALPSGIPAMHSKVTVGGTLYHLIDVNRDNDEGLLILTVRRNEDF